MQYHCTNNLNKIFSKFIPMYAVHRDSHKNLQIFNSKHDSQHLKFKKKMKKKQLRKTTFTKEKKTQTQSYLCIIKHEKIMLLYPYKFPTSALECTVLLCILNYSGALKSKRYTNTKHLYKWSGCIYSAYNIHYVHLHVNVFWFVLSKFFFVFNFFMF